MFFFSSVLILINFSFILQIFSQLLLLAKGVSWDEGMEGSISPEEKMRRNALYCVSVLYSPTVESVRDVVVGIASAIASHWDAYVIQEMVWYLPESYKTSRNLYFVLRPQMTELRRALL